MKTIAIKDANILIDCLDIDLLASVFQLPLTFQTTDFIWAEISIPAQRQVLQAFIDAGQLVVKSFTAAEVTSIAALSTQYAGISFEDASAMYLAEEQTAILLTGDGKLRRVCQQAKIEVHGIIWLLDQLVATGIISAATACTKVKLLQESNPRLPIAILQSREKQWCL